MDFTTCLREQLRLHPAIQPQDVIKLCYQAARGAEHLLADTTRARAYFDQEYAATPADAARPLFEPISENVARVNLAAWKWSMISTLSPLLCGKTSMNPTRSLCTSATWILCPASTRAA